jgi:hypothetical protein
MSSWQLARSCKKYSYTIDIQVQAVFRAKVKQSNVQLSANRGLKSCWTSAIPWSGWLGGSESIMTNWNEKRKSEWIRNASVLEMKPLEFIKPGGAANGIPRQICVPVNKST